jgi:hypothetical protein
VGGLKLAISAFGRLGAKILNQFIDKATLQPQSAMSPNSGFLINAMSLIIGYFTTEKFDVKAALKFFSDYKRRANIRDSLNDFAKIATDAYHNVRAYFFGNWEEYQFGISDDRLRDWFDSSSRMYERFELSKFEEDKTFFSSSNFELLQHLLTTGRGLSKDYQFCKNELKVIPISISKTLKELERVQVGFSKTSFK